MDVLQSWDEEVPTRLGPTEGAGDVGCTLIENSCFCWAQFNRYFPPPFFFFTYLLGAGGLVS